MLPACLGVEGRERTYLLDATPAIATQVGMLSRAPDAILLTHAHMGHIAGLLQLGKEALNRTTTLYASPAVCAFLRAHPPWNRLPLELVEVEAGIRNWNFTEVLGGLSEGDRVVMSLDIPELEDGLEVIAADD